MSVDILSSAAANYFPDKSGILDLVDDYTLFCYYLNDEVYINQVILSPLRDPDKDQPDSLPSFVIYESRYNKLKFYDHGKGGKGGDIFDFVQELYGLSSFKEACVKVCQDFGIGAYTSESGIARRAFLPAGMKIKQKIEIKDVITFPEFTAEGLAYWQQYYITPAILKEYNVKQVRSLISSRTISTIPNLAFSYRIGTHFKIYQPYEPEYKFLNNYPSNYVEGLYQLSQRTSDNELLIITKSTKDVMVLRLLGFDAISPKGENILISAEILERLTAQFKKVIIFFDNDAAGMKGAAKYNFPKIWIDPATQIKDISDFIKAYGPQETYELMLHLLNP